MKFLTCGVAACLLSCAGALAQAAEPVYRLNDLLELALSSNKGVEAADAGVDAARAGTTSAGAYPNPEIEVLAGRVSARNPGGSAGSASTLSLTQRLDLPGQRELRRTLAERGVDVADAGRRAYLADLVFRVRQAYYEVLRRGAEHLAAEEDLALARQIYTRAEVRVDVGDAPRYELIRAEAELLNAQRNSQSSLLRVNRAKSALRMQVGGRLPAQFALQGSLGREPTMLLPAAGREALRRNNPELQQLRAEYERANVAVDHERALSRPTVALRVSAERDPDARDTRVGMVIGVPLWDRRQGPINEAAAQAMRLRSLLEAREFELAQALDAAYQQYEIAGAQAEALESGIVRQAEAAMRVAEAAYRFGERGIIDYLDAQRVLRTARNDLIAAQFDLQLAAVEIDRLLAFIPGQ